MTARGRYHRNLLRDLIQLSAGRPKPLQYVLNAAFLATIYSDYLEATNITVWHCGSNYCSTDVLRQFANTQVLVHGCPNNLTLL
ncbi:hypothetical protein M0R45_028874 [Rubus argutus]|uniref:Uncharacterized protein n=1 Tax=Rubus argutus TaxID=59490 RepID=A0AAW1W6E6_RUBAR